MVLSVTVYSIGEETGRESSDLEQQNDEAADNVHAVCRRETKWRAFGFDSTVLQITDPWASKNMWFQQLTHSVRLATHDNCPCFVKIPAPNT